MLCIIYVTGVGLILGVCGLLVEQSIPAPMARRWIWCLTIPASLVVPAFYRAHHVTVVSNMDGPPFLGLDAGWWARIGSQDAVIGGMWLAATAVLLRWTIAHAGWVGGPGMLERRLTQLLAPVALRTARRCQLVMLAALLLALGLAIPHPVMRSAHPHPASPSREMAAR